MVRLRKPRKSLLMVRLDIPDELLAEATENDETDHLIEELVNEALSSSEG